MLASDAAARGGEDGSDKYRGGKRRSRSAVLSRSPARHVTVATRDHAVGLPPSRQFDKVTSQILGRSDQDYPKRAPATATRTHRRDDLPKSSDAGIRRPKQTVRKQCGNKAGGHVPSNGKCQECRDAEQADVDDVNERRGKVIGQLSLGWHRHLESTVGGCSTASEHHRKLGLWRMVELQPSAGAFGR